MNDGNELSFHSKYITQLMTQLLGLDCSEYRLMFELSIAFFADVSSFFLSQNMYIVR